LILKKHDLLAASLPVRLIFSKPGKRGEFHAASLPPYCLVPTPGLYEQPRQQIATPEASSLPQGPYLDSEGSRGAIVGYKI